MLARNYQCRYGESNIIVLDGETVVFVEVRSKRGSTYSGARELITAAKQRKLRLTVETSNSQLE